MLSKTEISAAELQMVAERIKLLRKKATEHAIEIGRELLNVKASLPHGAFVKWVETACGFKIRTAQDLMKLAREADSNAHLIALMVPSTLRVYLSRTTPPAVREKILARLKNGERVSRKDVHSAALAARSIKRIGNDSARPAAGVSRFTSPDLLTAGGVCTDGDHSRAVAELLVRRLSRADYEFVMDGMTWETWNRVFVWMRAAQTMASDRANPTRTLTCIASPLPAAAINNL
jgi:hypothetical protein